MLEVVIVIGTGLVLFISLILWATSDYLKHDH